MFDPYNYYITPEEFKIAEKNGISKKLLINRVRNLAWEKERAITEKPGQRRKLKSWIEIAEKNGICEGTFLNRIKKLKWDFEKASTKPVTNRKKFIRELAENQRKYPKEIIKLAEKNGISYYTFQARVTRLKMNMYDAATMPVMTKSEVSKKGHKAYRKIHGRSFGAGC